MFRVAASIAVLLSIGAAQPHPPRITENTSITQSKGSKGDFQRNLAPTKDEHRNLPANWREQFAAGQDQVPPRIDRIVPQPGRWVVNDVGLPQIQIGFTEPVTIPSNSVKVWKINLTQINNFTTAYDSITNILTITFAQPIRDTRLNVLVNFTITDVSGNALDGEIGNPANPTLPSGDGFRGGQAVFRFNILQGDANRDGVVNQVDAAMIRDSLGLDPNAPAYNPLADLNLDGAVNVLDSTIFRLAEGRTLQATDSNPPHVERIFQPDLHVFEPFDTITIELSEAVVPLHLSERSGYLVDADGNLIVPTFYGQAAFGDVLDFFFIPEVDPCGTYSFNITNGLADVSGELMSRPVTPPIITGLVPPPAPTLNAHTTSTKDATVTVTGTALGASTVEVAGPMGVFTVPVINTSFTANVPLGDNRVNPVFFTTLGRCSGVRSPPRVIAITRDNQPPNLFIDFPAAGASITTNTTDVAGRVGDILSGYLGLEVTVEVLDEGGMVTDTATATVNEGIGNNGTFFAAGTNTSGLNVSLNVNQQNTIRVTATDSLLKSTIREIAVTQSPIPPATPGLVMVSGNGKSGPIGSVLPQPIVVRVTKQDGTPFANKTVTFNVSRSNGRLTALFPQPTDEGSMMLQVRADANGLAQAWWQLGSDAGEGNNRVEVTSQSIVGTVAFCASATHGPVKQINIGMGNNQKAEAGGPAPEPLRAWVSDGCNGVPGQRVEFTVTRGGGRVNGASSVIVNTGDTGHADANFILGPDYGTNIVEAGLVDYPGLIPAKFQVYGLVREEGRQTTFSGIVLNNASQPIRNVKCVLVVGTMTPLFVYSDIDGGFRFDNVAGSGDADLYIDGSTANHLGGETCTAASCDVSLNTYPSLHFEMVVVPNGENSLTMPVMLPPLNPANVKTTYSSTIGDPDTILTVEGMEGLAMRVKAGSMTLGNGQPAVSGTAIYLNQVHEDAIPMPIPDGASPPFTWTLQPAGATFDPPIEITYPNMSGLPAGSIAYFLSFNHDTARFEIIASGHVTNDGAYIVTDPGMGLSLAGWGCNCPPYSVTGECCTGCDGACCDGACCCDVCCADGSTCCDGQCCSGKCCDGRCCNDCCNGQCCSGECCEEGCCPADKKCCEDGQCCTDCCEGECCDGPCCNGLCCPEGGSCCVGRCCDGPCCEETGVCCGAQFKSCCGDKCCEGPCCEEIGLCCGAQFESCCNNECCLGDCCEDGFGGEVCCESTETCCDQACCLGECCDEQCCTGINCCDESGDCCLGECCGENSDQCCEPGGECCRGQLCCSADAHCCPASVMGHCCPDGEQCCGQNNCCASGASCCDQATGLCCGPGQQCCGLFGGPKQCCESGDICCNGDCQTPTCSLDADPVATLCPGGSTDVDVVAFCRPTCANMQITWEVVEAAYKPFLTVIAPSSLSCASKTTVTVTIRALAETPLGMATIRLTGKVMNNGQTVCTVTTNIPVTIGQGVDLVFNGLPDNQETNPGGLICVNNDDDDASVRADKDDDPGPILSETDLKPLELKLNGLDLDGSGTLNVLQFGSGSIRLYTNSDRSCIMPSRPDLPQGPGPLPLPFTFNGSQLPITLHVEGYAASSFKGDIAIEMVYAESDGNVCADKVNLTVSGVEFKGLGENPDGNEFTGDVHRNIDLVQMTNAHPVITIDPNIFIASLVPEEEEIRGDITSYIRPLSSGDVTVNGQTASLTTNSMSPPEGPFLQHFSKSVTLYDDDLLVKAFVRDAAGSITWDKLITIANLNDVTGEMNNRSTTHEDSTPRTGFQDPPLDFPFRIEVRDPHRSTSTISATVDTGVGPARTIQLTGSNGLYLSTFLRIVPENTNLLGASQVVLDTRFPAKLGGTIKVRYTLSDGSMCEDSAIVTGAMFVRADDLAPLEAIQAGLARHVVHGTSSRNILVVVGAPGDLQSLPAEGGVPYLNANLTVNTFRDQASPVITTPVIDPVLRIDQQPNQPNYNVFRTKLTKPLLPLASKAGRWTILGDRTYFDVESGGFLRLSVMTGIGTFKAVKAVRGESVINILIDGLGAGFPRDFFPEPRPDNLETLMAADLLPNFRKLINDANGKRIRYDGHTTFPSITYSAWASWVTGADPKDHGVTGSNFYRRSNPASDPFWCGAVSDPNCVVSGGMFSPIDLVLFGDPREGVMDLDIVNVWSDIGTLNSAIRPTTKPGGISTVLYDRLNVYDLLSYVVYHFPFRGATATSLPSAWQGHVQHEDESGWGLDRGTILELESLMGQDAAAHIRPPQALTVYYAGLDTNVHHNAGYPNGPIGVDHLIQTDRAISKLVRILDQWNLMDDAVFTFTGDHGLSRVANDDSHSLLLQQYSFVGPIPVLVDNELYEIMIAAGFDPLDIVGETSHSAVLATNGGMAHVYTKNRSTNIWSSLPRYIEDVRVMAERFYDNNVGILDDDNENNNAGAIDLILVRNSAGDFNGPYEVLVKQGATFSTISLSQAQAQGMVDPAYVNFEANIQRLQDVRSGDIILLSAGICQNDATGYYFGAELPGWHGSLCGSDMTIPIIFSFPRGAGSSLTRFESILDANLPLPPNEARITNIEPTIYELLMLEAP